MHFLVHEVGMVADADVSFQLGQDAGRAVGDPAVFINNRDTLGGQGGDVTVFQIDRCARMGGEGHRV